MKVYKLIGMELNANKTKLPKVYIFEASKVVIRKVEIEELDEFTYCGRIITNNGRLDPEINQRIREAASGMSKLRNNLRDGQLRVYRAVELYLPSCMEVRAGHLAERKLGHSGNFTCVTANEVVGLHI